MLGPLLFLIYINDLHYSILFCKVHHFADDTNLLISSNSLKHIKNKVNLDLKFLNKWLKQIKFHLMLAKQKLFYFVQEKKIDFNLNIKIDGKKLYLTNKVKYLGIYLDLYLNWDTHINELSLKLARSTGMLSKIRYYVPYHTLLNIYYAIFSSHLSYGCLIWGQNFNYNFKKISILQNKAIRILHFHHTIVLQCPSTMKQKYLNYLT